jgi:hypothetical protein
VASRLADPRADASVPPCGEPGTPPVVAVLALPAVLLLEVLAE